MRIKMEGFTLIEMLAVLFIMGIIFSITLPTFGPIMSIKKLETSAQNLVDKMEVARQYSATMGIECYMVFPENTGLDIDNVSYKIYDPEEEKTVGKIEVLPKGIEFDFGNSTINGTVEVRFPEDTDSEMSLRFIRFKPNGGILPGRTSGNGRIRLYDKNSGKYQEVFFYNTSQRINIKEINE